MTRRFCTQVPPPPNAFVLLPSDLVHEKRKLLVMSEQSTKYFTSGSRSTIVLDMNNLIKKASSRPYAEFKISIAQLWFSCCGPTVSHCILAPSWIETPENVWLCFWWVNQFWTRLEPGWNVCLNSNMNFNRSQHEIYATLFTCVHIELPVRMVSWRIKICWYYEL